MRKNLPVSNVEYPIGDDVLIVSKTDTKGKLVFFNETFVKVSGFTEAELIDQPHNIVRHPDMPPEAFEDLWKTLKAGKPWAGAVKNRRKNGDFYWVLASATPIWENGQISGYMSIRSKLPADQRIEAEQVYAQFSANKAQGWRVDAGVIRRRSLFDYFAVFTRTLKARLTTLIAVQALFIIVMGAIGVLSTQNSNTRMKSIYDDRAIPLAQLFEVNDRMKEADIMLLDAAARGRRGKPVNDVAGKVAKNSEAINKVWAEYVATYLTPEEKGVADAFIQRRKDYREGAINTGLPLLAAGKFDEFDDLQAGKGKELFELTKVELDKLVAIQIKEAKFEFDSAQHEYVTALWISLAIVCFSLLTGGWLGLRTARAITGPVEQLNATMGRIAQGNNNNRIIVERDDELGTALRNIQAMQSRLGFDIEERNDRSRIAGEEKTKALNDMADTVERETVGAVGVVGAQMERMASNASLMNDSARTVGTNSGSVAAAAEQALANAQTLTKAASELNISIAEISGQISSSRTLTIEAVSTSDKAQATIGKLSEAAGKVGAVTSLISEIASQTNLLALNATIEAARAGAAGRGFAVVASEVKSLAEQTAKATSEIAQQISEIQDATRESVTSIAAIGDVIRNVDTFSEQITAAMERQSTVTQEISRTVSESAQAAREVASQIVNVSTEAAETGRRAEEIREGTADIAGKVNDLRAILVRVVRTSTTDVDRRTSVRSDLHRQGTVEINGRSQRVTVRNLSETGVVLLDAIDGVMVGSPVVVSVEGLNASLRGSVARNDAGGMLVKCELTEDVRKLVAALVAGRRAAA
jgi:PAS domain S-box-containing protein